MPKPIYAVVETYEDGVNVLLHHSKEKAIKRFQVILKEVFFDMDWEDSMKQEQLDKALKDEYYAVGSNCDGSTQTIQIQTLDYED